MCVCFSFIFSHTKNSIKLKKRNHFFFAFSDSGNLREIGWSKKFKLVDISFSVQVLRANYLRYQTEKYDHDRDLHRNPVHLELNTIDFYRNSWVTIKHSRKKNAKKSKHDLKTPILNRWTFQFVQRFFFSTLNFSVWQANVFFHKYCAKIYIFILW